MKRLIVGLVCLIALLAPVFIIWFVVTNIGWLATVLLIGVLVTCYLLGWWVEVAENKFRNKFQ